ncbi:Threonine/homoserine efflux transporter RhtA [Dyadobacter koreensis]|uniref:Threonine/homoserine efflux transporter RhtA n=1 Tax=Dyadobacter koreensis TaxID=408657 RepID=A0A1H6QVC7_9BACT|nr:DMT family transporter [Dyadobacter koreensis]SEI44147.1 Threonine/homoserine efflux transporter RhtA [Dyadobacter koreensis]
MKKAFFQLHISILLAGFTGVFGKAISLNEGLLVWYRMLISGILLLMILGASQKLKAISKKDFQRIALSGFLLGLHWIFFYGSIKYSNISVGVVCFSLTGFFTAILAPILNKKKFALSELLLSGLTLLGIGLIFSFDSRYRTGILLGVMSSLLVAFYTIANERLAHSFKSETIMVYQMIGGSLGLAILMPFYLHFFPVETMIPSWQDLGYLLMLSLFCTVLLYMLLIQALRKISAFTVNLSFNLEPIYTIALAILIYKENRELTTPFYIGLGLIILSVALQMIKVSTEHKKAQAIVV